MKRYAEIPIDSIDARDTARPLDGRTVDAIVDSMQKSGLLQPVIAQEAKIIRGGICGDGYRLIAGNHRVAAARRLGHFVIQAVVIDDTVSYIEAELIEIDENLCRADLTPAQRAAAIKRRKQIWEALHPESGNGVSTLGGRGNTSFAADTCAAAGLTKQSVNQHLSRADALGPDLLAVAGTSLDKGVELDALKAMPADQRAPLIARAQAGEQVTARKPAARISLVIEYFDVYDGASSIARSIITRDRALAVALLDELNIQLLEAA